MYHHRYWYTGVPKKTPQKKTVSGAYRRRGTQAQGKYQSPEATTNPNGSGGDNMRNTKKVIAATAAASNIASAISRYNKGLD